VLVSAILAISLNCAFSQGEDAASNATAEASTTGSLIAGVPALRWTDGMCTFVGSLNACLNCVGEKTTYQYLMGVSGAAFATRFLPGWCESSADAAINDDHPRAAMQAVGYAYTWSTTGDSAAVIQSLDRGVPVIGIDIAGHGDWGIIAGYDHMGEVWISRSYHSKPADYRSLEKLPWSVLLLGAKSNPPTMADNVRTSITLAVDFGQGKRVIKGYRVGFDGYGAWIEALQPRNCNSLQGKRLEEVAYINAWLYNCLMDARCAAVTYLTWAATLLKGEDKSNCLQAASLYQEELDILKEARDYVKYPQSIRSGPKWTAEMRAYESEALRRALEKDMAAIAALEKITKNNADSE
jgi:hypothetical protein